MYGSGGYWEMTGYPMFKRQDEVDPSASPEERAAAAAKPAIVDITMHMQEGEQFFVNRITFTGNTVTRDRGHPPARSTWSKAACSTRKR